MLFSTRRARHGVPARHKLVGAAGLMHGQALRGWTLKKRSLVYLLAFAVATWALWSAWQATGAARLGEEQEAPLPLPVRHQAVLVASGDLGSRLHSVCAARALSRAAGLQLQVLWTSDRWLAGTIWGDLFASLHDLVEDHLDDGVVLGLEWVPWEEQSANCSQPESPSPSPSQAALHLVPQGLYVTSALTPCRLWLAERTFVGCQLADEVRRCYRGLQPSAAVTALISESAGWELAARQGLLMQGGKPQRVPPPQVSACLASSTRQPSPSPSPPWGPQVEKRCWGPAAHWGRQTNLSTVALVLEVLREPDSQFVVGGSPGLAVKGLLDSLHPKRAPLSLSWASPQMQSLWQEQDVAMASQAPFSEEQARATGPGRTFLRGCCQRQLAELLVLSQTQTLIHGFPSGAVDFVHARAAANASSIFVPQGPFCLKPPLKLLTHQRWAQQLYVAEREGILYCSIPKVACTTWRLWMRRLQGLPDYKPVEVQKVHDYATSGLKILAKDFSDLQAAHLLTNPDSFKFSLVRDPWSRLLSAYLDKQVGGGNQRDPQLWNRLFFGRLAGTSPASNFTTASLTFPQFVDHVEQLLLSGRAEMEPHVAPQADLCGLHFIKYDAVGRFESLASDAERILARVRSRGVTASLPIEGRRSHATNSLRKLNRFYNAELRSKVSRVYFMDINYPLNNVSYWDFSPQKT